ncbi:MAG: putative peptidoglycan binding domain, partial [Rhodospirillaceae bacterium]|nr:putative peptidoglycan binding domain [Rhodospirillaceae bacterium]
TNLAALDGYGTFLSKPYRLVDLDYCLQKALATASIPDNETGGARTANPGTKTNPAPGKAQPGNARPNRPPAPGKADGRADEISDQSMAELARRLAERAARQRAVDPSAAKAAHRAALQAYDRARARRLRLVLGVAVGAVVGSGIAYLVPTVGSPPVPPSPSTAAARPEPASPIKMAAAASVPAPPELFSSSPALSSPSPAASVAYTPVVVPGAAQVAPTADSQPAPAPLELAASSPPPASLASGGPFAGAEPAPATGSQRAPVEPPMDQTPLRRDEMREVQARLRSFGFDPGSVDGVPGAMTESAVMHYQRNRGQPLMVAACRDSPRCRADRSREEARPDRRTSSLE